MADALDTLLTYIVEHPVMEIESRDAEMSASATQDVNQEIASIGEDQRQDADRLSSYFAEGIKRAARNGGKVSVDDTDPMGNGIADAFARFLVTVNLATSTSRDLPNNHYSYDFDIDWPRLKAIAQRAGVDLDGATGTGETTPNA
ncbi:MAG TPA: hypothetical protein VLQ48_00480 [Chloroflexia bacterium]|nr:hypothetical protein [Chloroflexia bacterium]